MKLSVIVPTYNETENIKPLCERLFQACNKAKIETELLIMDDESKGSQQSEAISRQLQKSGYNIKFHCRKSTEGRGLSSAVLLGFDMASNEVVLCMDGDLQHEPESVPSISLPVLNNEAEFSIGSRYCGEGSGFGYEWALHRRLISRVATLLAIGVSSSSDPMSGFFCCTKKLISRRRNNINAIGFKIGLEIMVKCRANPIRDVPITFQDRTAGESKLTMKQNILYVQQLIGLYIDIYYYHLVVFSVILVAVVAYIQME
jgi:dolichol-phosphate mannosyltransferase